MKKVASCIPAFLGVLHYVTTIAKTRSFITKKFIDRRTAVAYRLCLIRLLGEIGKYEINVETRVQAITGNGDTVSVRLWVGGDGVLGGVI